MNLKRIVAALAAAAAVQGFAQDRGPAHRATVVELSPAANTVKIDPLNAGRTSVVYTLAESGGAVITDAGTVQFLDVAPFARIRVVAGNVCTSPGKVTLNVRANDGIGWVIDQYELAPCEGQDKIYELPGASVAVSIWSEAGVTNRAFVQVFGR